MSVFSRFLNDESGATAIEYGLIAALISIAAIVAMNELGDELSNTFEQVSTELQNNQQQGGGGS